jgi:selenocysteine lyase/cysteine desulfurase
MIDGLRQIKGVRVISADEPSRRSGIVSFGHAALSANDIVSRLRRAGIVAIQRENGIRLSPHFYQRGDPVGKLLDTIEQTIVAG